MGGAAHVVDSYQTKVACEAEVHALSVLRTPRDCHAEACVFYVYCVDLVENALR
jgi:hypothetical protein